MCVKPDFMPRYWHPEADVVGPIPEDSGAEVEKLPAAQKPSPMGGGGDSDESAGAGAGPSESRYAPCQPAPPVY
jgi:hypothetical protein